MKRTIILATLAAASLVPLHAFPQGAKLKVGLMLPY